MQFESTKVQPFVKKKRDEMTFGYLPDYVLPDLVPDMSGSAAFYDPDQVRNLMMDMDVGYVGMRRSTIDLTEAVRQIVLYTTPVMFDDDGEMKVAVYQRSAGSEDRLLNNYSFGFGGHGEPVDLHPHINELPDGGYERVDDCPSSYFSTMGSGLREVSEEIRFLTRPGDEVNMDPQKIGEAILQHLGLVTVQGKHADRPLEEYTEGVIFRSDNFILQDMGDKEGLLLFTEPTPVDEVYRKVFDCEPVTNVVEYLDTELLPCGFLSDYKPEQKGFIGNTHIAVLGLLYIPGDLMFEVTEKNYTTIGWMTKDQIRAEAHRFEAWSAILIKHLDTIEELAAGEKVRYEAMTTPVGAEEEQEVAV